MLTAGQSLRLTSIGKAASMGHDDLSLSGVERFPPRFVSVNRFGFAAGCEAGLSPAVSVLTLAGLCPW